MKCHIRQQWPMEAVEIIFSVQTVGAYRLGDGTNWINADPAGLIPDDVPKIVLSASLFEALKDTITSQSPQVTRTLLDTLSLEQKRVDRLIDSLINMNPRYN